ncbi:MAG TPA: carboxypeptidase regulatory-like domain-containing protein [Bryobacteraceae bacterium]|nr:carboxypeptidase regulatory-like domain-containing protein [Bryobacteraceae bacterium]
MPHLDSIARMVTWGVLRTRRVFIAILCLLSWTAVRHVSAQTEAASVTGAIWDPQGTPVPGAEVKATRRETGAVSTSVTNGSGVFAFVALTPGHYRLVVHQPGFKEAVTEDLTLSVQDRVEQNFILEIGSLAESVTVEASSPLVNTQDASVSTVVDRQFAEQLPLNGRSFQSLIELTPGVVVTAVNGADQGQFSVNGQRADANYWTVDGVSANVGVSSNGYIGTGISGTLGATSVLGGTNSLVSVDALQEFRIQTSTYAPEYGRQPGGQISIVTRSGANQFHFTLFDYFRNDALDANDWFANSDGLAKPKERQNDFGGTLGGPIWKNKTFFFLSYEGLRLALPQTALTLVPDTNPNDPYSRQFALPALQPYLNAYPQPNGGPAYDALGNPVPGVAQFNASYSVPATMDAYSIRVDHKFSDQVNVFGRYNYSPSFIDQRGFTGSLNSVSPFGMKLHTATVGATWAISPSKVNDLRLNYSTALGTTVFSLDNFGGAVPLTSLPFPPPFDATNGLLRFGVDSLGGNGELVAGAADGNKQKQYNLVDSFAMQVGTHALKFGADYRRLSPAVLGGPADNGLWYAFVPDFPDIPSADNGITEFSFVQLTLPVTFLFRNLGAFAQDTWRVNPRLTLTYGIRWDVDFSPATVNGPDLSAVTGFNLTNLSTLALAPAGVPPYPTKWANLAPRLGIAYQLRQNERWQTVVRGGFGVFYDLSSSETGNIYNGGNYPYGSYSIPSGNFPLPVSAIEPPPVVAPNLANGETLYAVNPNMKLPYTLEWNVAIEQSLGRDQVLRASYVGADAARLLQTANIVFPASGTYNFAAANLVTNAGTSSYNALQAQYQRRLSHGLQALASYTWGHSIDTGSSGSTGDASNALSLFNSKENRGNSSFDIRHTLTSGVTYELPSPKAEGFAKAALKGWSLDSILEARTAPPVNILYSALGTLTNGFAAATRPDVVPGQPFYLYGPDYPGGKALNPAVFAPPPLDPVTGDPTAQGDLARNVLRGFGMVQWDLGIHREFQLRESLKLQFRAEMFNALNHPNFAPPVGDLGSPNAFNPQFGVSVQNLAQGLSSNGIGNGGFDPLYQIGGPRSVQLALKLVF